MSSSVWIHRSLALVSPVGSRTSVECASRRSSLLARELPNRVAFAVCSLLDDYTFELLNH